MDLGALSSNNTLQKYTLNFIADCRIVSGNLQIRGKYRKFVLPNVYEAIKLVLLVDSAASTFGFTDTRSSSHKLISLLSSFWNY